MSDKPKTIDFGAPVISERISSVLRFRLRGTHRLLS